MSVEYNVKVGMLKKIVLSEIVDKWVNDDIYFKCSDDKKYYLFFSKGSIRGFSVNQISEKELNIRVNHLASEKDADLVQSFLKLVNGTYKCKVYNEDKTIIKQSEFENDTVKNNLISQNSKSILDALFLKENYISLPLWDVNIVIYREKYHELKENKNFPNNLNTYLEEKALKLFLARRATQIQVNKDKIISVCAYDDMILYPADFIVLHNVQNEEEKIFVSLDNFINSEFVISEKIPAWKKDDGFGKNED